MYKNKSNPNDTCDHTQDSIDTVPMSDADTKEMNDFCSAHQEELFQRIIKEARNRNLLED